MKDDLRQNGGAAAWAFVAIIGALCCLLVKCVLAGVPLTDPILPPVNRPANCGGVE